MATAAALAARQRNVVRMAFSHRLPIDAADAIQVITEGLLLAAFSGDRYKSQDKAGPAPEQMTVIAPPRGDVTALERAMDRGTDPRRVLEPGARAVQRALEHPHALGLR